MRADQQISLLIAGDPLLITCEDPSIIDEIRSQAKPLEIDPTPLLGFHIDPPSPENRMWVLLGGNGVVLARARTAPPVVRSLLRRLSSMAHPQALATHRLRLDAIVGSRAAVLVDPYLLAAQPIAERRYERQGLRLLDSPYVDVFDDARLASSSANALLPNVTDSGHLAPNEIVGPVVNVLWRSTADATSPTPGQAMHALATNVVADSITDKLAVAANLCRRLDFTLVQPDVTGSVFHAASEHLS